MRYSRHFLIVAAALSIAGAAHAQRAPIVYAGQGQTDTQQTMTASLGDRLAGGEDNSYGYGANTQRQRTGAVIDIRRANGAQSTVQAAPPQTPAVQLAAATAPAADTGAQPWLERERVGPPYEANGRWYVPTPEPGYAQTGEASWYGPNFHGQATASGETYDQEAMTAAHPTLPLQSLVQVTNLANGREVIVRINDRGPFVGERLIDLSRAAADVLGFEQNGRARVHVRYLGPAPRRVDAEGGDVAAPTPAQQQQVMRSDGPISLLPNEAQPPRQQQAWTETRVEPVAYTPPQTSGAFVVQVGAFSDLSNAERVRADVAAVGGVSVDARQTARGELFRVRVGPFASREEADAARRSLASLGYGEAVVATR